MTRTRYLLAAVLAALAIGTGLAYAEFNIERTPTSFYPGHWHDEHGGAVNAPAHSGGTDANGCHNGSVPYHCH